MDMTIAVMNEIHSDYDWEITFNKCGSKYYVCCRWFENEAYNHKIKNFDTKESAVAFWNQQTLNILDSCYSLDQRLAQFN